MAQINTIESVHSAKSLLYTELSETEEVSLPQIEKLSNFSTLKFPEPELNLRISLEKESTAQITSENEKSISKALHLPKVPETDVAVPQQRKTRFRRCGGLSEY